MMKRVFHIIDKDVWRQAKVAGVYAPDSLTQEGFIHCSTASTLVGAANRFYRGRNNLAILCIDPELVAAEIKYEQGSDGEEGPFPHIYGELNLDAVVDMLEFPCGPDGTFSFSSHNETR